MIQESEEKEATKNRKKRIEDDPRGWIEH